MTIRSYVKIKPLKDDKVFSANFNEVRKGINRAGEVTENIGNNLVETHKLIQFEKEWLRDDTERQVKEDKAEDRQEESVFRKWAKGFKNMFRRKQREELAADPNDEGVPAPEGDGVVVEDNLKTKVLNKGIDSLKWLADGFLMPIFKFLLVRSMLKWASDPENAKRLNKVFRLVAAIGKFAWNIAKLGAGLIVGGLKSVFGAFESGGNVIEKGFSLLFGAFKLFAGFKTLEYLLNPLKLFTDGKKLFGLFNKTQEQEVEWKKQEQWRKFGYKDKESGKIYTEEEYKAQKKSVERHQKKLRKQGNPNQADKVGKGFKNRVNNPTKLQRGKNIGGKLMKPGAQKGLAIAGGLTRMASGIAMGEDKTQAVGAGLGQAAGGMIGAAAGTALLGPFLGPFAPIVGNAIGSFLGEWVGKTFLPVIKPIFEPIQRTFQMWFGLIKQIADETGITEFLGTFFKFFGQLAKVLFNIIGWIMKPITWLLSGVLKVIGGIIGFVIDFAKKIFAFLMNPAKVIGQVIWDRSFKNVGKDVKMEEFGDGGEMVVVQGKPARKLQSFSGGGPTKVKLTKEDIEPPTFVYSHQKFTSKTTEHIKNGKLVELKQEEDYFEVMGAIYYHILLKHHEDILNKLISMRLIKPHITIRDLVEGKAGDKIDPKVLYTVYKNSVAQKMSDEESLRRTKAFYKRHNLKMGESWMASNFSQGGAVNNKEVWNPTVGRLSQTIPQGPDFDIQAFSDKRDMVMKQLESKQRRDSDMDDFMILPPKLITIKETQPVINNVGSAPTKAVYVSPSPMLTC